MAKTKNKKPVIGRILRYTKPCAALVAPAVIAAVVSVLLSLYTPVLVGRGIDYIIGKNNVNFDGVKHYVLMITVTVALSALFSWGGEKGSDRDHVKPWPCRRVQLQCDKADHKRGTCG